MSDKKICPLKFAQDSEQKFSIFCEKEKCTWWDDFTGHCAILSISRHGGKGSFEVIREENKKEEL